LKYAYSESFDRIVAAHQWSRLQVVVCLVHHDAFARQPTEFTPPVVSGRKFLFEQNKNNRVTSHFQLVLPPRRAHISKDATRTLHREKHPTLARRPDRGGR
jgi:hypothetical protein